MLNSAKVTTDGWTANALQQHADKALSDNQIMRGPYVNTGSKDIGPDVPRHK